jgi:hypothetical protein
MLTVLMQTQAFVLADGIKASAIEISVSRRRAQFEVPAEHEGRIYLDLTDAAWSGGRGWFRGAPFSTGAAFWRTGILLYDLLRLES